MNVYDGNILQLDTILSDIPDVLSLNKQKGNFENIPVRRSDILRPITASFITTCFMTDDPIPHILILARQYLPHKSLTSGKYKWSTLRFIIPTLGPPAPCFFNVNVSGIDITRSGLFSTIISNCSGTIICAFSSRTSQCIVFPVPTLLSQKEFSTVQSKTLVLPKSQIIQSVFWHPIYSDILGLLTYESLVIYNVSQNWDTTTVPVVDVVDFTFIPLITSGYDSYDLELSTSFLCITLGQDGLMNMISFSLSKDTSDNESTQLVHTPIRVDNKRLSTSRCELNETHHIKQQTASPQFNTFFMSQHKTLMLIESTTSLKDHYTSFTILRLEPIFIICRLIRNGLVEVIGIDTDLETIQKQLLSGCKCSPFPIGSTLLHTINTYISWGPAPILYHQPFIQTKEMANASTPFVLLSTPEDIILVEFPWMNQIETCSSTVLAPPSLIPSNVQHLLSSTSLLPFDYRRTEDYLFLGFTILPILSLETTPRLFVLESEMIPVEISSPSSSISNEDTGWDICHHWMIIPVELSNYLASHTTIERYREALESLWLLSCPVNETPRNTYRLNQTNILLPDCRRHLQRLSLAIQDTFDSTQNHDINKSVTLVSSVESVTKKNTRQYTFNIDHYETVEMILQKLEMASLKLWKINSMQDQLESVQSQLLQLKAPSGYVTLEQQFKTLQKRSEYLLERIQKINKTNVSLLQAFQSILPNALNAIQHVTIESIEEQVPNLSTDVGHVMIASFSHVLNDHKNTMIQRLTHQLLLESCSNLNLANITSRAQAELLRMKVEQLMIQLMDVFNQHEKCYELLYKHRLK